MKKIICNNISSTYHPQEVTDFGGSVASGTDDRLVADTQNRVTQSSSEKDNLVNERAAGQKIYYPHVVLSEGVPGTENGWDRLGVSFRDASLVVAEDP